MKVLNEGLKNKIEFISFALFKGFFVFLWELLGGWGW